MPKKIVIILVAAFIYAVLRYVVFGPVAPVHVPVYILNKSVAMAAAITLFLSALSVAKGNWSACRFWGITSTHLAWIHILLSLSIISPAYYGKFFEPGGKLNLVGELTFLFGGLAAYTYWLIGPKTAFQKVAKALPILACLFLVGHLVAMGAKGWINVAKWHGNMPPISLVSLVFVVMALLFFLTSAKRHKKTEETEETDHV